MTNSNFKQEETLNSPFSSTVDRRSPSPASFSDSDAESKYSVNTQEPQERHNIYAQLADRSAQRENEYENLIDELENQIEALGARINVLDTILDNNNQQNAQMSLRTPIPLGRFAPPYTDNSFQQVPTDQSRLQQRFASSYPPYHFDTQTARVYQNQNHLAAALTNRSVIPQVTHSLNALITAHNNSTSNNPITASNNQTPFNNLPISLSSPAIAPGLHLNCIFNGRYAPPT